MSTLSVKVTKPAVPLSGGGTSSGVDLKEYLRLSPKADPDQAAARQPV